MKKMVTAIIIKTLNTMWVFDHEKGESYNVDLPKPVEAIILKQMALDAGSYMANSRSGHLKDKF